MKLYIPEIGDHITLTQDWVFTLYPEDRNQDLGEFFRHYLKGYNGLWVDREILAPMRQNDYDVKYPDESQMRGISYEQRNSLYKQAEQNCPEYVKYWDDYKIWSDEADRIGKDKLEVTLPAGTILSVDRIYIRKGASDFSSITFYAKSLGEIQRQTSRWSRDQKPKKKKSLRFWAKLEDCNKINFERTEKI
jgi:hypothetical protein